MFDLDAISSSGSENGVPPLGPLKPLRKKRRSTTRTDDHSLVLHDTCLDGLPRTHRLSSDVATSMHQGTWLSECNNDSSRNATLLTVPGTTQGANISDSDTEQGPGIDGKVWGSSQSRVQTCSLHLRACDPRDETEITARHSLPVPESHEGTRDLYLLDYPSVLRPANTTAVVIPTRRRRLLLEGEVDFFDSDEDLADRLPNASASNTPNTSRGPTIDDIEDKLSTLSVSSPAPSPRWAAVDVSSDVEVIELSD